MTPDDVSSWLPWWGWLALLGAVWLALWAWLQLGDWLSGARRLLRGPVTDGSVEELAWSSYARWWRVRTGSECPEENDLARVLIRRMRRAGL